MDALLWELLEEGSPDDHVKVLIRLSELEEFSPNDVTIIAQIGSITSCRIRRGDIKSVRANNAVASMKAQKVLYLDPPLDEHYHNIPTDGLEMEIRSGRPELVFTGKEVVIGIADWSFDFTHPNFLNADGTTRFRYICDQGA